MEMLSTIIPETKLEIKSQFYYYLIPLKYYSDICPAS